jgi:hypothetical protein
MVFAPPSDPAREETQIARLTEFAANDLTPNLRKKILNFIIRSVIHHQQHQFTSEPPKGSTPWRNCLARAGSKRSALTIPSLQQTAVCHATVASLESSAHNTTTAASKDPEEREDEHGRVKH